jgi:hypothetical protein
MTDEQINAAIHDALGNPIGCPRCSDPACSYNQGLNYCNDLNAMHEAEKVLTSQQEEDYFANLRAINGDLIWYRTVGKTYRATARQQLTPRAGPVTVVHDFRPTHRQHLPSRATFQPSPACPGGGGVV